MTSNNLNNEIYNALKVLKKGGVILYPTDTVWGIGCDATNSKAIKKIYEIKKRKDSKALISLVANEDQLKNYTDYKIKLEQYKKPTTIIYPYVKNLAKDLLAEDKSAAIRVVKDLFCKKLILNFSKAIVSTSANLSGEKHPEKFLDINQTILKSVDYIVNLRKTEIMTTPSDILKIMKNGSLIKLR
tara:strand:- start:138 stop:695 length:558 start_codon:yes stop_codon:yes gene_type:complete